MPRNSKEHKKRLAKIGKEYHKLKNRKRVCYHKSCNENAINSHILQRNGILSGIAPSNQLFEFKPNFLTNETIEKNIIGIKKAFTFKGFCNNHDTSIFKPIEGEVIDYDDYQSQLLFAYRTLLNEKRKREILKELDNYQLRLPEAKNNKVFIEKTNDHLNVLKLFIQIYSDYEELMVNDLENGTENFIFKTRYIDKEIELCIASYFTLDPTYRNDDFLIYKNIKVEKSQIHISVFPIEGETVLIMGYLKKYDNIFKDFIDSYFSASEQDLLIKLNNLILRRCEQWVCSIDFYEKKIKHREAQVIETIRNAFGQTIHDKEPDFNLFEI